MSMRSFGLLIAAAVLIGHSARAEPARSPAVTWRAAPALTRLFTPVAAPPGSCQVSVTALPIERVAEALRQSPGADPGAWQVRRAGLTEAFGAEGPYDRARLARLINGGRIRIARGSITAHGAMTGYTLVTPVPDAAFESLRSGTMIVEVHIRTMLAGRKELSAFPR